MSSGGPLYRGIGGGTVSSAVTLDSIILHAFSGSFNDAVIVSFFLIMPCNIPLEKNNNAINNYKVIIHLRLLCTGLGIFVLLEGFL